MILGRGFGLCVSSAARRRRRFRRLCHRRSRVWTTMPRLTQRMMMQTHQTPPSRRTGFAAANTSRSTGSSNDGASGFVAAGIGLSLGLGLGFATAILLASTDAKEEDDSSSSSSSSSPLCVKMKICERDGGDGGTTLCDCEREEEEELRRRPACIMMANSVPSAAVPDAVPDAVPMAVVPVPSWVSWGSSDKTTWAECERRIQKSSSRAVDAEAEEEDDIDHADDDDTNNNKSSSSSSSSSFDPVKSDYYVVELVDEDEDENENENENENETKTRCMVDGCERDKKHSVSDNNSNNNNNNNRLILHNRMAVLPSILTEDECKMIVDDTERILDENRIIKNIRGKKTESWAMYSRFSPHCQDVMDRLLGQQILEFLDQRMPEVSEHILLRNYRNSQNQNHSDDTSMHNHKTFKSTMALRTFGGGKRRNTANASANAKEVSKFCWDDPVVIKYDAGNKLAPHEDMRDLTIVIPLNPLMVDGSSYPLEGGGTRFWLEGTTPECANADDGILIKPPAGWGIIFNGLTTHSGESVQTGTRFVLMTSIVLDDEEDDDDDDDEDDGDDVEEDTEEQKTTLKSVASMK